MRGQNPLMGHRPRNVRPLHSNLHLTRIAHPAGPTQPAMNYRLLNRTAHGPCSRNQMNGAVTFYRKIAADAIA